MKSRRFSHRNNNNEFVNNHKSVNQRSEYLAELAKRKAKNNELVKMMKISQFYDEILEDVPIVRDYSFFSNRNQNKKLVLPKIFRPDVRLNIVSESEKNNPSKYKKKDIVIDKFTNINKNGEDTNKNFPKIEVNKMRIKHNAGKSLEISDHKNKIELNISVSNQNLEKVVSNHKPAEKLFVIEKYPEKANSSYYKVIKDGNTKVLKKPAKIFDYISNVKNLNL